MNLNSFSVLHVKVMTILSRPHRTHTTTATTPTDSHYPHSRYFHGTNVRKHVQTEGAESEGKGDPGRSSGEFQSRVVQVSSSRADCRRDGEGRSRLH